MQKYLSAIFGVFIICHCFASMAVGNPTLERTVPQSTEDDDFIKLLKQGLKESNTLNSDIVAHLNKGMQHTKKLNTYHNQIEKQLTLLNEKKATLAMSSAQSILRPTTQSIRMMILYLRDAYGEFDKASKLAYQVNCLDSQQAIDGLKTRIDKTIYFLLQANETMKVATTSRGNTYIVDKFTTSTEQYRLAMNEFESIDNHIDDINNNPCFSTKIVNAFEQKNKKKAPTEDYDVGIRLKDNEFIDYVEVSRISENSAASAANISVGDVLLAVGNTSMKDVFAKFAQAFLNDQTEGKKLRLKIYSKADNQIKTFDLATGISGEYALIREEEFVPEIKEINFSNAYYKGETRFGEPHGQGYMKFSDQEYYTGNFVSGIISGEGERYYKNGSYVKGEFSDGKPNGYGVVTFASGNYYEGIFKQGKKHGLFVCTINGEKLKFIFDMDKTVSKVLIEDEQTLRSVRQQIQENRATNAL